MLLDSLLKLVETLRERIDEHGDALRQSEALTRYALIDPMLRELGWDTDDPALVVPEYRSGSGSADYALMDDDRPLMMVEAKKLDTPLRDAVLSQGINYCLMEGTKHFTVTDGQRWEIYETHKPVPIDEKRIVAFNLKGKSPAEVCLKALALWRPSVESGYVAGGSAPVAGQGNAHSTTDVIVTPQPPSPPNDHEWEPLSELSPQLGTVHPVEVRFPDGSTAPVRAWGSLLVEVVRWLLKSNHLKASDCPIKTRDRNRRYLVAVRPVHSNGNAFSYSEQVGELYVEKKADSMQTVKATQLIVKRVGQDSAQFKIRFPVPPS